MKREDILVGLLTGIFEDKIRGHFVMGGMYLLDNGMESIISIMTCVCNLCVNRIFWEYIRFVKSR